MYCFSDLRFESFAIANLSQVVCDHIGEELYPLGRFHLITRRCHPDKTDWIYPYIHCFGPIFTLLISSIYLHVGISCWPHFKDGNRTESKQKKQPAN